MAKQILSFEEYSKNLKGSDVGEHENPEGYPAPEGETDDVEDFNEEEVEEDEEREEEVADAEDVEEAELEADPEQRSEDENDAEVLIVSEMVAKVYKNVVMEACDYAGDDYDDHTLETYMKENAALVAGMAAQALEEAYKEINEADEMANETYEAMMNEMKEAYCNKIDQCRESFTGAPRGYAEDEA